MHWMGPYFFQYEIDASTIQLNNLDGMSLEVFFYVIRLKLYKEN